MGLSVRFGRLILIAGFLFLAACGKKEPDFYEVDSRLEPYLQEFVAVSKEHGDSPSLSRLAMGFDSNLQAAGKAGICRISERTYGDVWSPKTTTVREIMLNEKIFFESDEYYRLQLVFHELGHCFLGLSHDDRHVTMLLDSGLRSMAASWMNTYIYTSTLSLPEKDVLTDFYIEQMFAPRAYAADSVLDLRSSH